MTFETNNDELKDVLHKWNKGLLNIGEVLDKIYGLAETGHCDKYEGQRLYLQIRKYGRRPHRVMMQSGATRRLFEGGFECEQGAVDLAEYYNWRWVDEDGFEWDLYVEEDDDV